MFKRPFCWAYFRGSLFSERLTIGGNFAFQNGLGLTIKTASTDSPWAVYTGGPIIGRIFASEIWGAYFREGLFLGEGLLSEFYSMYLLIEWEGWMENIWLKVVVYALSSARPVSHADQEPNIFPSGLT